MNGFFPVLYEFSKIVASMIESIAMESNSTFKKNQKSKGLLSLSKVRVIDSQIEALFKCFIMSEEHMLRIFGIEDLKIDEEELLKQKDHTSYTLAKGSILKIRS